METAPVITTWVNFHKLRIIMETDHLAAWLMAERVSSGLNAATMACEKANAPPQEQEFKGLHKERGLAKPRCSERSQITRV